MLLFARHGGEPMPKCRSATPRKCAERDASGPPKRAVISTLVCETVHSKEHSVLVYPSETVRLPADA